MPLTGYFIDANLFVLLVVGSEGRSLISKHRRLRGYSAADFDILVNLLDPVGRVYVTPNTLTETSNLLGQHGEPERSQLFRRLRAMIGETEEVVVDSTVASSKREFERLGLTDAALLEVASPETPVITVDFGLYDAAARTKGPDTAVNFTYHRDL